MLFDEDLAKHPIILSKVILVLVDFNLKMEDFLDDMKSLFQGLELNQEIPLDKVDNISLNTKEIYLLAEWKIGNAGHETTPIKLEPPKEKVEENVEKHLESKHDLEHQPDLQADVQPQPDPQPKPTELDSQQVVRKTKDPNLEFI